MVDPQREGGVLEGLRPRAVGPFLGQLDLHPLDQVPGEVNPQRRRAEPGLGIRNGARDGIGVQLRVHPAVLLHPELRQPVALGDAEDVRGLVVLGDELPRGLDAGVPRRVVVQVGGGDLLEPGVRELPAVVVGRPSAGRGFHRHLRGLPAAAGLHPLDDLHLGCDALVRREGDERLPLGDEEPVAVLRQEPVAERAPLRGAGGVHQHRHSIRARPGRSRDRTPGATGASRRHARRPHVLTSTGDASMPIRRSIVQRRWTWSLQSPNLRTATVGRRAGPVGPGAQLDADVADVALHPVDGSQRPVGGGGVAFPPGRDELSPARPAAPPSGTGSPAHRPTPAQPSNSETWSQGTVWCHAGSCPPRTPRERRRSPTGTPRRHRAPYGPGSAAPAWAPKRSGRSAAARIRTRTLPNRGAPPPLEIVGVSAAEGGVETPYRPGDVEAVAGAHVLHHHRGGHRAVEHLALEAGLAAEELDVSAREPGGPPAPANHVDAVEDETLKGGIVVRGHRGSLLHALGRPHVRDEPEVALGRGDVHLAVVEEVGLGVPRRSGGSAQGRIRLLGHPRGHGADRDRGRRIFRCGEHGRGECNGDGEREAGARPPPHPRLAGLSLNCQDGRVRTRAASGSV